MPRPPLFTGKVSELRNFQFQLKHYLQLAQVQSDADQIAVAVTCLSEKALLWWRGKSAILTSSGISFSDFLDELDAEFCDPDHDLRVRRRLHSLKQTGSVNAYIAAFRNLQMELGRNALTDGEAWFTFCEGLKPAVRHQVYINRPSTLADAMLDAERVDSALYFAGGQRGGRADRGVAPMELGAQFGDHSRDQRGRGRGQQRGGGGRRGGTEGR